MQPFLLSFISDLGETNGQVERRHKLDLGSIGDMYNWIYFLILSRFVNKIVKWFINLLIVYHNITR